MKPAVTLIVTATIALVVLLAALPSFASPTPRVGAAPGCPAVRGCAAAPLAPFVAPPLGGLVTSCSSASSCHFVFNTTAGLGYANASPPSMTLRLPGEAVTSSGLSYSTYTASLTGTYTYWTVGHFVGTDVTTGKVVYGTTNTNYTITCHGHSGRGGGCTYTYTTDNGTIVVFFTDAEQTSTSVRCAPSTIGPGGSANCTATVNDTIRPSVVVTGNVSFAGPYGATTGLSGGGVCTLVSGACTVVYTAPDEQLGTVAISATFAGTPSFYTSAARTSLYVSATGPSGGNTFSTVLFNETGLVNGTNWSVTFAGLVLSSVGPNVSYQVQNGTYPFSIAPVAGYSRSPAQGNVSVTGDGVVVNVSFSSIAYPVTFTETGLPLGRAWSVSLDGLPARTTNGSLVVNEPNGSYSYLLSGPAGFQLASPTPTGNLSVTGAPQSIALSFVRGPTYPIVFAERGLPRNATWCVVLVGLTCAATPTIRFANLTPGSYSYDVVPMVGQVISARVGTTSVPLAGELVVGGHAVKVLVRYTYPYAVTFTESGLPAGTNWTVTIGGVVHYSTNTTIVFGLGNGTHSYRLGVVVGYLRSGVPTAARVLGGPASVSVTFRP